MSNERQSTNRAASRIDGLVAFFVKDRPKKLCRYKIINALNGSTVENDGINITKQAGDANTPYVYSVEYQGQKNTVKFDQAWCSLFSKVEVENGQNTRKDIENTDLPRSIVPPTITLCTETPTVASVAQNDSKPSNSSTPVVRAQNSISDDKKANSSQQRRWWLWSVFSVVMWTFFLSILNLVAIKLYYPNEFDMGWSLAMLTAHVQMTHLLIMAMVVFITTAFIYSCFLGASTQTVQKSLGRMIFALIVGMGLFMGMLYFSPFSLGTLPTCGILILNLVLVIMGGSALVGTADAETSVPRTPKGSGNYEHKESGGKTIISPPLVRHRPPDPADNPKKMPDSKHS